MSRRNPGGSGRVGSGRRKVEHMLRLDIARLQRQGLRRGVRMEVSWSSGASISLAVWATGLRLTYRVRLGGEEWQEVEELVPLVATQQRLGGQRQWFACPGCYRRCRVLYGSARFRCRHCHDLRFTSQSETKADRANRGMFRIVRRLDPEESFNDLPARRKGMHRRTYERLVERYGRYEKQWQDEAMRRFGIKF